MYFSCTLTLAGNKGTVANSSTSKFLLLLHRLQEKELTTQLLEAEKKQISDTALHLQQNLEVGCRLHSCSALIR